MENQRLFDLDAGLHAEADAMLAESGLGEIIRSEGFHPAGSYVMRTMTWRDLDFEREHEQPDWSAHWELGRRLAACKWVWKFSCADAYRDPQNQDVGHYWGLRVSNPAGGPIWKLDLWTARAGEFAQGSPRRSEWMRKLNDENRLSILAIKDAVCTLPVYRKTLLSVHIYQAVLDDGISSIEGFRAWLEKR